MKIILSDLTVLPAPSARAFRWRNGWRKFRSALCLSFVLAAISTASYAADIVLNNVPVKVYFSPNGGCAQAIIDEINKVQTENGYDLVYRKNPRDSQERRSDTPQSSGSISVRMGLRGLL